MADEQLLTYRQAAEYLGMSMTSLRWRVTNANCPDPVPSVKTLPPGRKKPARYFHKAALDEWNEQRKLRRATAGGRRRGRDNWPPTPRDLLMLINTPGPDPDQFPDDGRPVPGYRNLAGRWVQPAWIVCLCGCGVRFLSPDRTNVRFRDACRSNQFCASIGA